MPQAIHDQWCAERGVGGDLPYAALDRVWNQLDEELSVGPAPDAVFGQNNALMEQAVATLGWKGNRIRRNVKDCQGSAHCNQGCPTARRQSMNNSYVPRAIAQGARVYADCRAERLVIKNGRAAGVAGRFGARGAAPGPSITVRARSSLGGLSSFPRTPESSDDIELDPGFRRGDGELLDASACQSKRMVCDVPSSP